MNINQEQADRENKIRAMVEDAGAVLQGFREGKHFGMMVDIRMGHLTGSIEVRDLTIEKIRKHFSAIRQAKFSKILRAQ